MRYFVTGASGFIGSAVVPELLSAGHEVVGLARSDVSAQAIEAAGGSAVRGGLADLDVLRDAAAASDGVLHLAYIHDFSAMDESAKVDEAAIAVFIDALAGSGKPLVIASGALGLAQGRTSTEEDRPIPGPMNHRATAAELTLGAAARGVRSSIVRLAPSVHGEGDASGFVPTLVKVAREQGVSGYVGDGANQWPAVHVRDAAVLFRLAAESAEAGSVFHGVADEGVSGRAIAEAIAAGLDVPTTSIAADDAARHFGWIGPIFSMDAPASSARTQAQLGWTPTHPTLLEDLAAGVYTGAVTA